ncbi:MAG: hypothetical protein AAGI23_09610 [Bacteroidota bacterium]
MPQSSPDFTKDYELIRRYFDFELDETELNIVNERMESDPVFFERMRLFSASDDQILNEKEVSTAQKEAKTIDLTNRKSRSLMTRWRALAAAVVLLIGSLFAIWYISNSNVSPSQLAQTYWSESEKVTFSTLRSDDASTATEDALITASQQFQEEDYTASLATLSTIPTDDTGYHKVALLKGEIYFEQNNFQAAVDQFQAVIDHPNNEYNDYGYWYQTLAYLELGEMDAARENLVVMKEQRYLDNLVKGLMEEIE